MAAVKKNKKPMSQLITGKKTMNKWIVFGGVAAVAIIGILVVRYSSASTGTVWSPRSQSVTTYGGTINQKSNGSAYWIGSEPNSISLATFSAAKYCVEGSIQSASASAAVYHKTNYIRFSGKKGQKFSKCVNTTGGGGISLDITNGTIVVNRFVRK